jgi:hypothetical protein
VALKVHAPEYCKGSFVAAEMINNVASVIFVLSQALAFLPQDELGLWLGCLTFFASNVLWAINGFQYLYTYFLTKDAGPAIRDLYFHSELYNTIGSVGYVFTSGWPVVLMSTWVRILYLEAVKQLTDPMCLQIKTGNGADLAAQNNFDQLVINLLWDALLTASALCCLIQHLRDKASLNNQPPLSTLEEREVLLN